MTYFWNFKGFRTILRKFSVIQNKRSEKNLDFKITELNF